MAPDSPPDPRPFPNWLLRRADQAGVAALVLLGLASVGGWWVAHGGCRGRLIEIDRAEPRAAEFQVDLNEADWPELVQLPGIGETLARRIVESRNRDGRFLDNEDLQRVRGIGPKTLDRIRPYLRPMPQHETIAGGDVSDADPS
jgi:competence protein ComEA